MSSIKFSKEHEWILIGGDVATIGITDHAQEQLGEIVYVELPDIGRELSKGEEVGVIESVKAASEIYSPVSGEVTEINETLADAPETVNSNAMTDGWLYKLRIGDSGELDELMDEAAYKAFCADD
jgi:glycine cleavage system H protein